MRVTFSLFSRLISFSFLVAGMSCTQVDVSGLNPDLFTNSGQGGGGGSALCDGVDADFSQDVLPVLQDKCDGSGCHTGSSPQGNLDLDDDNNKLGDGESGVIGNIKGGGFINLTSPAQSKILLEPLATSEGGSSGTHTGGQIFNSTNDADYKKIFCWVEAGAKNDLDDSLCTFGAHVYPIFSNITDRGRGCAAGGTCHGASSPGGGMNLLLDSKSLLGTGTGSFSEASMGNAGGAQNVIAGDSTNSLLPNKPANFGVGAGHGGGAVFTSTSDPDYQLIKCWIDEGAQDN